MTSNTAHRYNVEFSTSKVQGVFVHVPDGVFNTATITGMELGYRWLEYPDRYGCTKIPLPGGNVDWKIVGRSHSMSKEEIQKMGISFEKYMKLLAEKEIAYNHDKQGSQWLVLTAALKK